MIFYLFPDTFGSSGGLFGQPAQNQNAGLFGKSVAFGAPAASTAQPVFNFGASPGTSLFGQNNQQPKVRRVSCLFLKLFQFIA